MPEKKKRRWDQSQVVADENGAQDKKEAWHEAETPHVLSAKDAETPRQARLWDATPGHADSGARTPPDLSGLGQETPRVKEGGRRRWDETPKTERTGAETPHSSWAETPRAVEAEALAKEAAMLSGAEARKRSRWDETPAGATPVGATPSHTPSHFTPSHFTPSHATPSGATPAGPSAMLLQTPGVPK